MGAGKTLAALALLVTLGLGTLGGCGGGPGEREYKAGQREYDRGRYVRARALFEKSIARRPGSPENSRAYYYLGLACRRLGQVAQALEAFESSARMAPDLAEPKYGMAAIYFESGDLVRAEPLFQEVALARPTDPRPLEFLGEIHVKNQNWMEARRVLTVALARAPQSARILTAIGRIEARAGQADQALFYLMQALEKDPNYPPALFNLGMVYRDRLADPGQAEAYFRKYGELVAQDAERRNSPQADYVRQIFGESSVPTAPAPAPAPSPAPPPAPQSRNVEELLSAAAEEARQDRPVAALNLCLEAAGRAERDRDSAKQEKALNEAVRLAPTEARAFYALGRFQAEHERHEAALETFKQAVTLQPTFTLAQLGLAEAAVKKGELDSALVACRAAVRQEPDNPDALWRLGTLYEDVFEMPDAAAQTWRDFERLFPGDPRVIQARQRLEKLAPSPPLAAPPVTTSAPPSRPDASVPAHRLAFNRPTVRAPQAAIQAYNRAAGFQQQGDLERAVYFYTRAIENDDQMVLAFFNLGVVHNARRDFEPARAAYEEALALQPDLVSARYNLAVMLMETGDRAGATEHLQNILQRQPKHPAALYALGTLYAQQAGTYELARRHYRALLDAAPDHPEAPVVRRWLEQH